jgi:hypothetical protein
MSAPPVVVLRILPEPMLEIANEVVVACVVVALIPVKLARVARPLAVSVLNVAPLVALN